MADDACAPISDILIEAARIAFARQPDFSLYAPTQPSNAELIRMAFTGPLAVRKRRVRPRMTGFQQPSDDDDSKRGSDTTEGSSDNAVPRNDASPPSDKAKL